MVSAPCSCLSDFIIPSPCGLGVDGICSFLVGSVLGGSSGYGARLPTVRPLLGQKPHQNLPRLDLKHDLNLPDLIFFGGPFGNAPIPETKRINSRFQGLNHRNSLNWLNFDSLKVTWSSVQPMANLQFRDLAVQLLPAVRNERTKPAAMVGE
ncbi:predicted protein [Histoplasma capsulatum var. duboisii H88]|uniref:Predicted protein n=1 Tax=Ajellomyces capsulatus (strain H88) TaxID=544711 RepID=F0U7G6_AJEC8|nr:predicted protein [Histoplasma capsulatum var. duboisii H88]